MVYNKVLTSYKFITSCIQYMTNVEPVVKMSSAAAAKCQAGTLSWVLFLLLEFFFYSWRRKST